MTPGSYRHITGAGDDGVVYAAPTTLHHVVVGTAAAAQTLSLHDCATVGAAVAGNLVGVVDLAAASDHTYDLAMRLGLVAIVSGGAPDITICWG